MVMLPESESILDAFGGPGVSVRKAIFAGVRDGFALVDMGDSRFVCDFGSGYIPVLGETVRVWSVGGQHMLFPAGPRPNAGTVLTVSATTASVQTTVGDFSMPFAGASPTSGDRVGIVWSEDGPWCTSRLSSTTAPPGPVPDPGGGGTVRSATFRIIDSGSTDRSKPRWWTARPRAGNSTFGAWFYGTQIRDTIPAGATFQSLEFYVSYIQRSGSAPRFALHGSATKAGIPSFGAYTEWAPGSGWKTPPNASAWFNALKSGGGMLGVGLNQGGDNIFASRADNSMSGALRIFWRI